MKKVLLDPQAFCQVREHRHRERIQQATSILQAPMPRQDAAEPVQEQT